MVRRGCRRKDQGQDAIVLLMSYLLNLKWLETMDQSSSVHPLVPEKHVFDKNIQAWAQLGV